MLPTAGIMQGYTTTSGCGAYNKGAVLAFYDDGSKWSDKVLHSFGAGGDGTYPVGGVKFATDGNLYGTTQFGGTYGFGTVHRIGSTGKKEAVLNSFKGGKDGAYPRAGLNDRLDMLAYDMQRPAEANCSFLRLHVRCNVAQRQRKPGKKLIQNERTRANQEIYYQPT